jgi:hypothetical protein
MIQEYLTAHLDICWDFIEKLITRSHEISSDCPDRKETGASAQGEDGLLDLQVRFAIPSTSLTRVPLANQD